MNELNKTYRRAMRLARELPCPTCGKSYVRVFSHEQTGRNGEQAWCPECQACWRICNGCPVEKSYLEPMLGLQAKFDAWFDETFVHDPWPLIDQLLDSTTLYGGTEMH